MPDFKHDFWFTIDASNKSLAAVFKNHKKKKKKWKGLTAVVSYWYRALKLQEKKYTTREKKKKKNVQPSLMWSILLGLFY